MELPEYVQSLSFRLAQPDARSSVAFSLGVRILAWAGVPLDAFNTRLPCEETATRKRVKKAHGNCRRSAFAVGAILNRAVVRMACDQSFVALGIEDGFPLLAAMSGNPDKQCIGVDDFRTGLAGRRDPAREDFIRRFQHIRGHRHEFHPCGFRDYVRNPGESAIGFCFLGEDPHNTPLERLRWAEERLGENACVLVGNCNRDDVRDAALHFMRSSRNQFRVLLDRRTPHNGALTFGNGVLLFQLLGRNMATSGPPKGTDSRARFIAA
jgi:hypothetical protein